MGKETIVENNIIISEPTINIFSKYLYDIKNLQTLDEEMINNIYHMTCEEKMSIIKVLNDVIINFKFLFE